MAPVVNGLAASYQGKVEVRHIDANTDPVSAEKFNLRGVPTYIFLDSTGEVVERQEGGNPSLLEQGFKKAAGQ